MLTKFIGFVNSNRTELLTVGSLVLFCIPMRVTLIYLMRIGKPKATPENNKCNHMLITGLLGILSLGQGKKCRTYSSWYAHLLRNRKL